MTGSGTYTGATRSLLTKEMKPAGRERIGGDNSAGNGLDRTVCDSLSFRSSTAHHLWSSCEMKGRLWRSFQAAGWIPHRVPDTGRCAGSWRARVVHTNVFLGRLGCLEVAESIADVSTWVHICCRWICFVLHGGGTIGKTVLFEREVLADEFEG